MISAREAREETYKKIENNMENELILVEKKIKEAMNNGDKTYSTCYDGVLSQETIARLRVLGYKVEYGSQYNESYYMISW